jgi:thiol-disulfide isomerase/thioredoxin
VTLTGREANTGYVMFDVEDQDHHVDRNGGEYWDSTLCFANRNAPDHRIPNGMGYSIKYQSYNGTLLAPGFQRPPDTARGLAIVREDFAKNPMNFGDLFWIWTFETKGGYDRGSDADWAQVSRELDDAIAKYSSTHDFFMQIMGFVGPNEARIDPAVIARLRASIVASPQTISPIERWPDGSVHPVSRTQHWADSMAKSVTSMLSQLDLPLAQQITDPGARGAAFEAFTKKYGDCETLCRELPPAFGGGVRAYAEAGDLDSAKRLAESWMAWDPKNPDPPATLANAYLDANKRLPEALELMNRAAELYQPYAQAVTRPSSDHSIRSLMYFQVTPYAGQSGRIELLRGKIEAAMEDWRAAAGDLQKASDDLAGDKQMFVLRMEADVALGNACEHTGAQDIALRAYLRVASGPYQRGPDAHDRYVHLFVDSGKGTEQQAEDSLVLAAKEQRAKEPGNYVPVELHRPLPKLRLAAMNGKEVRLDTNRCPVVVDLWATWCPACELELPSLLAFQKSHPEVVVLAVDVGDKPEAVTQFLTSKRLTGLHVVLTKTFPEGMAQDYPTTFVLSRKHELAFLHQSVPDDIVAELGADIAALNPQ